MRRALLVPHQHMTQFRFPQRIINWQNCPARVTENFFDAQPGQCLAKYFRTRHLSACGHKVLPESSGMAPVENESGTVVIAPSDEEEPSSAYFAKPPRV